MKKKVTIIAFILILFCISKVQAFSDGNTIKRTEEKLEDLIETKTSEDEDTWKFIDAKKYTEENNNMIIYKIGNEEASEEETYLQYLTYDQKIKRIIKNGYKEKDPNEYGLSNENDLYLATKIALDCLENNKQKEDIDKFYRPGSLLTNDLKTRAENIIEAAKEILDIGINGTKTYSRSIGFGPIGEIEKDNIREGYYSQLYKVDIEGEGCRGYKVEEIGENSLKYIIANADTSEEQKEFSIIENQFKILIPEEHKHDDFTIEFKLTSDFLGENFYIGTDWTNKYIVFAKEEEKKELSTKLYNRRSTLAINFIDEETSKNVYGVAVEVDGQDNYISEYNNIVKRYIPKSTVHVKVKTLPDDYEIENTEYDIEIVYNEEHVETLKLKHKKGKVEVTTNVGGGVYEIYDLDSNKIVPHIEQDDGNVYIANINTGKYSLKQISVNDEYELANDIEFEVKHNETTKITVENTLKEKIKEDEEDKEDAEDDRIDAEDENDKKEESEENHETEKPNETEKEQENGPSIPKEEEKDSQDNIENNSPEEENQDNIKPNEKEENNRQEEGEKKPNLEETTQDKIEEPKEDKDKNKEDTNNSDNKQEDFSKEDSQDKEPENNIEVEKEEPKKEENSVYDTNDTEEQEESRKDNIENDNKEDLNNEQDKGNSNIIEQEESDEEIRQNNFDENIETLPRTGNDYFYIKLIFTNLLLFTFLIFLLNKKQTARKI